MKELGDIMYLNVLQQPILVVSSAKIAIDLLEKRGAIYSDRPLYTLAGEMAGYNQVLTLLPYGPDSRLQRKILHKYLGTRQEIDKFVPLLELENHWLLRRVLDEPDGLVEFLRLFVPLYYSWELHHDLFSPGQWDLSF
jgi:hypothetical protein